MGGMEKTRNGINGEKIKKVIYSHNGGDTSKEGGMVEKSGEFNEDITRSRTVLEKEKAADGEKIFPKSPFVYCSPNDSILEGSIEGINSRIINSHNKVDIEELGATGGNKVCIKSTLAPSQVLVGPNLKQGAELLTLRKKSLGVAEKSTVREVDVEQASRHAEELNNNQQLQRNEGRVSYWRKRARMGTEVSNVRQTVRPVAGTRKAESMRVEGHMRNPSKKGKWVEAKNSIPDKAAAGAQPRHSL
jgi:hypothetical protein